MRLSSRRTRLPFSRKVGRRGWGMRACAEASAHRYAEAGADELVLIGGARDTEGMVRVLDELAESAVEPALRV